MIKARATKLSVFDEPEAGIDLWSFNSLIHVFEDLHEKTDGTILIISHQERILEIADRIIVINDGLVEKSGKGEDVIPELLYKSSMCQKLSRDQGGKIMDLIQKELLEEIAGLHEVPAGAYNIRANGKAAARNTTANIDIVSKEDKPGIDIIICLLYTSRCV